MNAFALLAHHKPRIDYTRYCDEHFATHLDGYISTIEQKIGTSNDSNTCFLEDSALVRRIERIFPQGNYESRFDLVMVPGLAKKKPAIALLELLYSTEESYVDGIVYNLFPEAAQCAENHEHVNIIAFIALGKLSRILGLQWTHLNEGNAFSRLHEYIVIYRDRMSQGWLSSQHLSIPLPEPSKAILWPSFICGAGGANEQAKKIWVKITRNFGNPTASSTAAQEINTTPSTPSTPDTAPWGVDFTPSAVQEISTSPCTPNPAARGVELTWSAAHDASVITDIDSDGSDCSDGSFDWVSHHEDSRMKNLPGMSVF